MKTTQKVIKIGSSYGVILPKQKLAEDGTGLGDMLDISTKASSETKHTKLMKDYDKFVKQYSQALKNLAKR